MKVCSPAFFERLVGNLLVAMGYGGSRADAGKVVGKRGAGGLDAVYIRAKRWVIGDGRYEPTLRRQIGEQKAPLGA